MMVNGKIVTKPALSEIEIMTEESANIDQITISTQANAVDFGDLATARAFMSGFSNSTRGLAMGGYSPSYTAEIRYIQMATLGNAVNFGDLTVNGGIGDGTASKVRAVAWGRYKSPGANDGTIDYVTIATIGNAIDFGDIGGSWWSMSGTSNGHGGLG